MTFALLLTALAVAAPGIKDPPKKAPNPVGEWVVESITFNGQPVQLPDELRYELTDDGRYIGRRNRARDLPACEYKLDPKAVPPAIDLRPPAGAAGPRAQIGIYKVDGNTLTMCLGTGERPTAFESPAGSGLMLVVMTRAKKD